MFKRALIASDLSPASTALIECMGDLKSLNIDEVILFNALGFREPDTVSDIMIETVKPELMKQKTQLEEIGFNVTLEIATGIPSEEIKRVSKEKDVSFIVIGSHGESAFRHKLFRLGGVASEVLNSHEKPLLFLRTNIPDQDDLTITIGKGDNLAEMVLFAADFADISMLAFEYVERLVEDGTKNVTLLHVQDKTRIDNHLTDKLDEFNRIDQQRLELRKDRLIGKGAQRVDIKIPYGIPAQEILEESDKGYSLIVMGSQGRGFFHSIFIGSVSYKVARYADISVMLVPARIERR